MRIRDLIFQSAWTDAEQWQLLRNAYRKSGIGRWRKRLIKAKYDRINFRNCASIPIEIDIGDGLQLPHGVSGIFISIGSQIGANCTILQHVTLGTNSTPGSKKLGAPIIGDNVFIGAGAVIVGGVYIGSNVRIGANTTVISDIPDNSTVISTCGIRVIPSDPNRDNHFFSFKELSPEMLANKKFYNKDKR